MTSGSIPELIRKGEHDLAHQDKESAEGKTMKMIEATIVITASLTLALTGCSVAAPPVSEKSMQTTPTPAPTMDSGPVTLTKKAAAERYLNLVCANNLAINELAAAFDASEDDFLNGGAPDPGSVKSAAATRIALNRKAIDLLDDTYYIWPKSVEAQLPNIRSTYMAELTTLDTIANAPTFETAYYATWGEPTPEQKAAGQEIRYQLSLDADTKTSCSGHENGLQQLADEKAKRQAELGQGKK